MTDKKLRLTIDPSQRGADPMDEIARAARRKRERDAKRERKELAARGTPESRARVERNGRRELMFTSLGDADTGGRQYLRMVLASIVFPGLVVGANVIPRIRRLIDSGWGRAALIAISLVASFATYFLSGVALARWQLWRIYRVGHGLDVPHYLALLGQRRSSGTLRVVLHCTVPWDKAQQKTAIDAIAEWDRDVAASWRDERVLELRTEELFTTALVASRAYFHQRFFTNRPIHDAFMRIVHRVLPKLHAANPVVAIEVAVDGEVLPYDADP